MRPQAYERLWALAVELAPTTQTGRRFGPARTFDSVGLILRPEEGWLEYDATPRNAETFAKTGGDGVHFSFLRIANRDAESWPVVMTIPMGISHNFILGANCLEFLSLGCRYGYFRLEQLEYDWKSTVAAIQVGSYASSSAHEDHRLLATISERFGLQPWPEIGGRLVELQEQFHALIEPAK